jgi:exonuclease III
MKEEAPSGAKSAIENQAGRPSSTKSSGSGGSALIVVLIFTALLGTVNMQVANSNVPKITFASINCNSLNMSSIGNMNHLLKVYGVTSLKSDIIFLSDIRLCNQAGASNISELNNSFRTNPHCSYKFFHNSHSNKRGVGILIKHTINFSVLAEERDEEDNILCLKIDIEGKEFVICSIYGPNHHNPAFFTTLRACLTRLGSSNTIIGGDWNCTGSMSPPDSNIDILNMQNLPNARHSTLLKKLSDDFEMSDPFRVKFPNRKDYSFFSKDPSKNSRSRLDFFITSNCLIGKINKCYIKPCMQNKMFDHRAVIICFKDPPKIIKHATVSRELLTDPDLELYVGLSIADTYLIHTNAIELEEKNALATRVGTAKMNLRRAGPDKKYFHDGFRTELEENIRAGRLGEVREVLDEFPFNVLQEGGYLDNINDDWFMETLINNIRNECISYQTFLAKTVKESTSVITKKLLELKADYIGN